MIKIAIVEDNESMMSMAYDYVNSAVKTSVDPAVEIKIEKYSSAEQFLEGLNKRSGYDILLADIVLPQMSGVDLGKMIRSEYPEIYFIFLTSYMEFAIDSYRIGAYQYILKEEMDERLPQTIGRLAERISRSSEGYRWIGTERDRSRVSYKEIICVRKAKESKYVEYITIGGVYRERISMNQLMKELNNEVFMLADRSHIINLNHIIRLKGDTIYLAEDERIVVTSSRMAKVKKRINTYWRRMK